jgi:hypothetical protein
LHQKARADEREQVATQQRDTQQSAAECLAHHDTEAIRPHGRERVHPLGIRCSVSGPDEHAEGQTDHLNALIGRHPVEQFAQLPQVERFVVARSRSIGIAASIQVVGQNAESRRGEAMVEMVPDPQRQRRTGYQNNQRAPLRADPPEVGHSIAECQERPGRGSARAMVHSDSLGVLDSTR